jgi:hypothetical protein
VAFFVEIPVDGLLSGSRRIGGDLRFGPDFTGNEIAKMIRVICRVGDDVTDTWQPLDKGACLRTVTRLSRCDRDAYRVSERVNAGVDFGGQPAFGAAYRVNLSPPFWPVAPAWTFEMVASTSTYSKSGSSARVLKRFAQTPATAQRRNRQCVVCQLPRHGGRSRQSEAVRASHNTASTKSRLSAPVRPLSPGLPGKSCSIRAHCASLKVRLLKIASVFDLESELTRNGNPSNEDTA